MTYCWPSGSKVSVSTWLGRLALSLTWYMEFGWVYRLLTQKKCKKENKHKLAFANDILCRNGRALKVSTALKLAVSVFATVLSWSCIFYIFYITSRGCWRLIQRQPTGVRHFSNMWEFQIVAKMVRFPTVAGSEVLFGGLSLIFSSIKTSFTDATTLDFTWISVLRKGCYWNVLIFFLVRLRIPFVVPDKKGKPQLEFNRLLNDANYVVSSIFFALKRSDLFNSRLLSVKQTS